VVKALSCIFLLTLLLGSTVLVAVPIVGAQNDQFFGPLSMGAHNFGGEKDDYAYSIQQTSDVGLIMAGKTLSYGAGGSDMWLYKTGLTKYYLDGVPKGVFQGEKWNMTYGGSADDGAYSVIQTSEGGFAAAGFTASFGAGKMDMYLIKTDVDGKLLWSKNFGGTGDDCAFCLIQTSDGGFLLSGYTNSGVPQKSAWIVKTDMYGNKMWDTVLPGKSANSVLAASDEGYVLAVESPNAFRIIKTDSIGSIEFDESFPVSSEASTQSIVQAEDGGYALAGWVSSSKAGGKDSLLIKTDSLGKQQWSQTYPGVGAYAMVKTSKGGYALTGERALLLITDEFGKVLWNQKYDGQYDNDTRYLTSMHSIIEAPPDHFVMTGYHDGGQYAHMQAQWIQVTLKSGDKLIPPETSIIQPENKVYTTRDVPLTFYVNEPAKYLGACLNGYNFTIDGNTTLKNLPNGKYDITVYVTDNDLNHAASQTVSFTVDSTEPYLTPKVTITSPINQTYNTTQVTLNFTVDQQIYHATYSLDGQENKTALPNIAIPVNGGIHTLTVYVGGIADGPAGSDTVTFNVTTPSWNYEWSGNNQYNVAVNQIVEATVQAATSQTFLISAAVILIVAVGVLAAFIILVTRKGSKRTKKNRLIR
jgi:hypothetical protein